MTIRKILSIIVSVKNHSRNASFVIALIFFSLFELNGQIPEILVTGSYDRVPLITFLQEIENQYGIKFFYDKGVLADVKVTENFSKLPLNDCLNRILRETRIRISVAEDSQVILFSGNALSDLFPGSDLSFPINEQTSDTKKVSRETLQNLKYKIINIGSPGYNKNKTATLSGYLKNFESGAPISGGNVYVSQAQKGVSSDNSGFYSISLPVGNQILNFSCIGMEPSIRNINLYSDGRLDVDLEVKMTMLKDAVIIGQGEGNVGKMHIGMEKIDIMSVKLIPTLLGESDIIRSVLTLPGVQTVGEGTSGFNVRGGSTDQNLILIDRATLYYPSHFFGNFSAINSEIIESATLYKGSIPVNYGGRISSVFEINSIDGNKEKISGSAGISPIYARVNIDGPLFSKKSSFLTSFRSTYSDWLLSNINVPELYNSTAGFYDIQGKLDLYLNEKNKLLVNFYSSTDRFRLHSDTTYSYKNTIGSLILNHKFNSRLNSSTSLICSLFNYKISDLSSEDKSFTLTHHLSNYSLINDFEYNTGAGRKYIFGAELNFYTINPGERRAIGDSNVTPVYFANERALEYGVYAGTDFSLSDRLKVETGLRVSGLLSLQL
ncbi:MAG: TonB-dependent receptor [Bacteroidales bacterium]|nr:TonB-dependent receptor [Bacteroidales bacterium]